MAKGYSERSEGFISAKSYLLKNALNVVNDIVRIEAKQASYTLAGQFKKVGFDKLTLHLDLKPDSVLHLYIAFVAANRSQQSGNLHLGELTI